MLRLLVISAATSVFKGNLCTTTAAMSQQLQAVDFEVYGKVQGVFFRKYTKAEADRLDIRGWCRNTFRGTVTGHLEGPLESIGIMMQWLKKKGSPSSVIERVEFNNQEEIHSYNCQGFRILVNE